MVSETTADHSFAGRHLGVCGDEARRMAQEIGYGSVEELAAAAVPRGIRRQQPFFLPEPKSEAAALDCLKQMMGRNERKRSLIGMGYHDCHTPSVILRNILENPGWYTAYTPYQPEISQGRLEACLNFQTLITELSGLAVANASLLDEATAAAEAMTMCAGGHRSAVRFFVSDACHPQTLAVMKTRAEPVGIELVIGDHREVTLDDSFCGVLVQYPDTNGQIDCFATLTERAHAVGAKVVMVCDLMSLVLLQPPGQLGADIAVGSSQRFGVPLGFGGPHAAWIACTDALKRRLPGRLVGVSRDAAGRPAYRLALQTREQHIRRDKATSNICTAQVLLAVMASMYAVYHGPEGLKQIARRIHRLTCDLAARLQSAGVRLRSSNWFDTLRLDGGTLDSSLRERLTKAGFNVRWFDDGDVGISLDERSDDAEVQQLAELLTEPSVTSGGSKNSAHGSQSRAASDLGGIPATMRRSDVFLQQPVFNTYHTETEMMRYLHRLESKDLALNTSMIPLGSCTMKLNAASEMLPITWPEISGLHPFAPREQWQGFAEMIGQLEQWLAECTGFHSVSLQPNAGSQGEFAGLLAIRDYHHANGQGHRNICLIPASAHGTNPASAVMVGMKVVAVECDRDGNIDILSLRSLAEQHRNHLSALMVTYPSTHGVFEEGISDICRIIHDCGGQVYMDGANLNAQLGLCSPGEIGADVCHLNLHKTFC
ncbi:MAG: aminomethyl-transferring glycine dehydrogenase, partial [Planctomycetaceae bacterium]|nr:aminomethyl-transferring glycine dehydrogenase [Planctomycetaceae bacterium]